MPTSTLPQNAYLRYRRLQQYVGWTDEDSARVAEAASVVEPAFEALVDDFYAAIEREPGAARVITGGASQIARLKGTLLGWLKELFGGVYNEQYVARRWQVGWRHVEIGLDQVFTNVALSRLRRGLLLELENRWAADEISLRRTAQSLSQLLDLDLAIIEDAYQTEHVLRRQRTERLAAIGQVAGGIAHELRNPLNVIKTSVYFLLNARNPAPEKVEEHLRRIERQVEVSDGVITALSDFAKLPLPEFKPVPLEESLREALSEVPLHEGVEVVWEIPPGNVHVLGDRRQLGIVFGNLFRNARDAMPDGGRLTISVSQTGEQVTLAVSDSGAGIAPENLSRVWEPLYSTKARGIGLGLPVSRAIIEKHSGSLDVSSELTRGTTFTIALPAATREQVSHAE